MIYLIPESMRPALCAQGCLGTWPVDSAQGTRAPAMRRRPQMGAHPGLVTVS